MSKPPANRQKPEPPAMGERRARWGFGYQDKVATERILNILRDEIRFGEILFDKIRLADLYAGRVDDFVLVWKGKVEGNSIKWGEASTPFNWGDLIGKSGLIRELADGYQRLTDLWPDRVVSVHLQSNRPASAQKQPAQIIPAFSVKEFLCDGQWHLGPESSDSREVSNAWQIIAQHVGLPRDKFTRFVAACTFSFGYRQPPGVGPNTLDWAHYTKQFGDLHKAIATWLTDNPDDDYISRDFLLAAIGYRPIRSGLIHRFPAPEIPYERNASAAHRLKYLADNTSGGYLAVTGPAGVGKSTLVQDVLSGASYPCFVPYYAFLPNVGGNRDRGEALTFFQDVVGRLDTYSADRLSLGISEVAEGREALRRHMLQAHERYVLGNYKTVLLIDGLDHVAGEVGLENNVLNELPLPEEIPDGFLIILSSQPQALAPGTISPSIAGAVSAPDRRVEVEGLKRPEVHLILDKIEKPITGDERDSLYDECLGNPLVLTYLLTKFLHSPDITVEQTIRAAGRFDGRIEPYYRNAFALALQEASTRHILGLLCRAAPTIPMAWLMDWPESIQLEDIFDNLLAPFIRVEEEQLHFLHASLIAFLKAETRTRMPGQEARTEQRFYSTLADRCGDRPCSDPLGRAHVFHLLKAEAQEEVLELLSSKWLREGLVNFLPYAVIRPLLLSGLEAAWTTGSIGSVVRLILLDHEFDQRTSRIDAGSLAERLLELDAPDHALAQLRSDGRLLADVPITLQFAKKLARYARRKRLSDLERSATALFLQARPVPLLYQSGAIDPEQDHDALERLGAWAEAAPLFEEPVDIIATVNRLCFTVPKSGQTANSEVQSSLLYRALLTSIDIDATTSTRRLLLDAFSPMAPTWRFAALLRVARASPAEVVPADLIAAHAESDPDDDLTLAFAMFLCQAGYSSEAQRVASRLSHIRFDGFRERHSFGFTDITFTVELRRLQDLLGLTEGPTPGVKNDHEEVLARIETTARRIGALLAAAESGRPESDLHGVMRALLLFHNRPVLRESYDRRDGYPLNHSRHGIEVQIMRLATESGPKGIDALRDVLVDLLSGPACDQFSAQGRRYFAQMFYQHGSMSREDAVNLGLSSMVGIDDSEPMQRQETCLEIAVFLHSMGEQAHAKDWLEKASDVSAGAGSHKDYQMEPLAEWLRLSVDTRTSDEDFLGLFEKFARSVEVAGGARGSDAAKIQLGMLLGRFSRRSAVFAVELVDRGVLNLNEMIEALIVGGAQAKVSGRLLLPMYCELYALTSPSDSSSAAVATLRSFDPIRRPEIAAALMTSVRTNALPSQRVGIAQSLQDALLEDGFGLISLADGLSPVRNDTSQGPMLYKMDSGESRTLAQVADWLSDGAPDSWNPNPTENEGFNWWEAIKATRIKDQPHIEALLSTFQVPEYRQVEVLAWKSQKLMELGEQSAAREIAEEAVVLAKDGSWHQWLDGAKKVVAYRALKFASCKDALLRARSQFGKDLVAGRLNSSWLLANLQPIFELLEIDWPKDASRMALSGYLDVVLAGNEIRPPYQSMNLVPGADLASNATVEEALCRVLVQLLAFPVCEIGIAARRALARYVKSDGSGIADLFTGTPCWDSVQLEHLLISIDTGAGGARKLEVAISALTNHPSVGVRGVARRICERQRWAWHEVSNKPMRPLILLGDAAAKNYDELRTLLDADAARAVLLHGDLFSPLERSGISSDELRSEFIRAFYDVIREYLWKDDDRLQTWVSRSLARQWLHPRAVVGREAAMRVIGCRALSGDGPRGAEQVYDHLAPVYDPAIELLQRSERPTGLSSLDWSMTGDEAERWRCGEDARNWAHYPEMIEGLHVIGERTWLIRPDWEWPREERYRGLLIGPYLGGKTHAALLSAMDLTYALYLEGDGQDDEQLVVLNSTRYLDGGAYQWAAISSTWARRLGWSPIAETPFAWRNARGELMVKSLLWRDGWIALEPPRFEALGQGCLVLATYSAVTSIRQAVGAAEMHLWVERHSHGNKPFEGKWHLSRTL